MKIKNIILVSLLLVILTVGAVSAAEDVNETISSDDAGLVSDEAVSDFVNISVIQEDTLLKDSDESFSVDIDSQRLPDGDLKVIVGGKEAYNQPAKRGSTEIPYSVVSKALGNNFGVYNITFGLFNDSHLKDVSKTWKINYTYYKYDLPYEFSDSSLMVFFAKGVAGTVTLTVDNKVMDSQTIDDNQAWLEIYDLKYGKHNYKLDFKSKNSAFKSFTHKGNFNYGYLFDVLVSDDEIYYGDSITVEAILPWDIQNKVTVTYNGKSKSAKADEEGCVSFGIDDLKLGENNITVSYPKDSNYPAKSKTVTVNVKEILNVDGDVGYMSTEGVFLKLPDDAKGNFSVIVDDVENLYALNEGIAKVDLSKYDMGVHTIKVNYTGDDYSIKGFNGTFNVVANFIYLENVYYKDGVNIAVSLPSDANGTLTVSYDNRYKKANVVDGAASVFFNNIEISEGLKFTMEYSNGNYADYKKDSFINSRDDPSDGEMHISIPQTVLSNGHNSVMISLGAYSEGYVNITIDGKYCGNASVEESSAWFSIDKYVKNLKAGKHNITIDYSGDDYYTPKSNTTSFNIDFYRLYSADEIVLGYDNNFEMIVNQDVTGAATLNIAGKTIKGQYDEWDDDESYPNKCISFDLSKIPCGEYTAKLVFAGDKKYAKFTKELKLNVTYLASLDVDDNNYYGENTTLHFIISSDNLKANITVGNKTYSEVFKDKEITLEVANSQVGVQNVILTTVPTANYPQKTFNWTYYVSPKIYTPERINIIDGGNVTLALPSDVKGTLVVSIYDKGDFVKNYTAALENGTANININLSKLGYYEIIAEYIGDDYNVKEIDTSFAVTPKITYPHRIYVGEDANLTFEMPSDANGNLTLAIAAERLNATYTDGKAVVAIPHLPAIEDDYYPIYVLYEDPVYGIFYDDYFSSLDVMKYTANITSGLPKEIIAKNYITVTLTLPSDATGWIYHDEGSVKVNKGKATFKAYVSKAGKSSIWYSYSGNDKYSEEPYWIEINALPTPKLTMNAVTVYCTQTAAMKVKVIDSYGKIAVGKSVTFYVNGKKVKGVTTDKKGYATLKLKKAPGTYNVKAAYKGGVVTKKLTVKHVLTLKTVKVKKSARKLVLKATLKQGKKALKGKKVTFKFNGKTYKAKTDKKGVAKVTIKKKTLKKLKKGKKVAYQATYLNDIVKKTAKVLK